MPTVMDLKKAFEALGIDPVAQKRKLRPCKKKFLAVKWFGKAIMFYGSYGVKCPYLSLEQCVYCSRFENIRVLIPERELGRMSREELKKWLLDHTWGNARKLIEKYVLPKFDRIMNELEEKGR